MYLQESKKPVTVELCVHTLRNLEYIMEIKTFPDGGISRIPEEVAAVSVAIRELAAYLREERDLIPENPGHQKITRAWGTENVPETGKRTTTKQWLLDGKTYADLQFLLTMKIIFGDETETVTFVIDRLESTIRHRNAESLGRVEKVYGEFLAETRIA